MTDPTTGERLRQHTLRPHSEPVRMRIHALEGDAAVDVRAVSTK